MKTVVITGANAGIGLATAKALASKGYNIITVCRDAVKGDALVKELKGLNPQIQVENFAADLSDLKAVYAAAVAISAKYPVSDTLIINAGYYPASIQYIGNIEKTFYASHLGHMLLTLLLQPTLERSTEARVINVSSDLHKYGKATRFFKQTRGLTQRDAYHDAKLANILFTIELAKRLPGNITAYSLHPGVVSTNFAKGTSGTFSFLVNAFRPFFLSPARGASTTVYLADVAFDKISPHNGKYFVKSAPAKLRHPDANPNTSALLWSTSEKVLRPFLQPVKSIL